MLYALSLMPLLQSKPFYSSLAHNIDAYFSLTDNVFQKECGDGQVNEKAGYIIGSGDKRPGGHRWIDS